MLMLLTVNGTASRLMEDNYKVSEYSLRRWIKTGQIPCVMSGTRAYINYGVVMDFLLGQSIGHDTIPDGQFCNKIRPINVKGGAA